MWKDYSIGFLKKNRASSVSVLVAALISALFLSLLCGLFYNFWKYEIESVVLEEGNWQGRIRGTFAEDAVPEIENFANVKTATIRGDLSDGQTLVVDICFDDMPVVKLFHPQSTGQQPALIAGFLSLCASAGIGVFDFDHSQLVCRIYERPPTSVWHPFQHWGDAGANSHLPFAGSGDALHAPDFAGEFYRHCFDVWRHPGRQRPCRWDCRPAGSRLWLPPPRVGPYPSGIVFDGADFRLAARQKVEQDAPAGSHKKYGGIAVKAAKSLPPACVFLWDRGGTCRERAESTAEIAANRYAVVDPFFSGLYAHVELFYALGDQHKPHLL